MPGNGGRRVGPGESMTINDNARAANAGKGEQFALIIASPGNGVTASVGNYLPGYAQPFQVDGIVGGRIVIQDAAVQGGVAEKVAGPAFLVLPSRHQAWYSCMARITAPTFWGGVPG